MVNSNSWFLTEILTIVGNTKFGCGRKSCHSLAPQVRLGDNQSNRVAVLEAARIALGPVAGISEVLLEKARKIKLEIITFVGYAAMPPLFMVEYLLWQDFIRFPALDMSNLDGFQDENVKFRAALAGAVGGPKSLL